MTRIPQVNRNSADRVGSGRVGPVWELFETAQVRLGRTKRFSHLDGGVGSVQDLFQSQGSDRFGSRGLLALAGQVKSADPSRPVTFNPAREPLSNNSGRRPLNSSPSTL